MGKLYLLGVLFRLVPPSFTCILTSAGSYRGGSRGGGGSNHEVGLLNYVYAQLWPGIVHHFVTVEAVKYTWRATFVTFTDSKSFSLNIQIWKAKEWKEEQKVVGKMEVIRMPGKRLFHTARSYLTSFNTWHLICQQHVLCMSSLVLALCWAVALNQHPLHRDRKTFDVPHIAKYK